VGKPNTFSGSELDRAGAHRTDERWIAAALADERSRAVVVTGDGVLATTGIDGVPSLARVPLTSFEGSEKLLLGIDAEGAATFAVDGANCALPDGAVPLGLRDAGALLSQGDGGLIAHATALVNWHRRHPHCAVCGSPTRVAEAGHLRACPQCGAQHHPRTDPVVIMVVESGERLLLGRQARWPRGRYSALAGFVEPAETLEEAVAREVLEESGVEVRAARYVSSQPWPFPSSLMIGFVAEHAGGEPSPRDNELEDVRWFAREELEAMRAGEANGLNLPPPIAIARRLIDGWLD
jgi:NAD+ diphosphatase